ADYADGLGAFRPPTGTTPANSGARTVTITARVEFYKALPARRQRFLLTSSVVTFRSGIGLESLAEYDLRRRHFRGGLPRHRLCYSFRAMISCGRCLAGTQDVQQELPGSLPLLCCTIS